MSRYLPLEVNSASEAERLDGFRTVILFYSSATAIAGVLTWILLPDSMGTRKSRSTALLGLLVTLTLLHLNRKQPETASL